jgi:Histidine kinase-, DNA gyrase B-, and HSP90-like ATPase
MNCNNWRVRIAMECRNGLSSRNAIGENLQGGRNVLFPGLRRLARRLLDRNILGFCLFNRFIPTKSMGLGMGLTISRTIIESHGGGMWAENNPEGGATFCFTLKIAEQGGAA